MLKVGILFIACVSVAVTQPSVPLNLVFLGDSLTEGVPHFAGEVETFPFIVAQNFTGSIYTKLAYRGQTSDFLLRNVGVLFPLHKDGYQNVVVLWAGTNDCAIGPLDCAGPIFANLSAIAGAAHAAGWSVVVVTIIARDNYFIDDAHRLQFVANQGAVNAALPKSGAFDAVVDPSDVLNDARDTGLFWDACHLTPRGYAVVAGGVIAAIRGLPSKGI